MQKNIVAIIPARSGSKRIPKKNILNFLGKPMLCWSVSAAQESRIFDEIMVSTDSEEIAKVAKDCGAAVPFLRDKSDADDFTPVWTATVNALIQLERHRDIEFDIAIQLMPNCPLRTGSDIQRAYEAFLNRGSPFQISVFKYGWMNPWWAMTVEPDSMRPTYLFPQAKKRSQDLAPLYCPTGAVWIADARELKRQRTFYGEEFTVFPMDWRHAIDIDDMDDFQMAVAVAKLPEADTSQDPFPG